MALFDKGVSGAKAFRVGTHRTRTPQETFAAYAPLMPLMGITRLANVTGLDRIGVPVYMGVRPNSRNLAVSQGKGLDPVAAKVSAMMEAIEGWSAESFDGPIRYESPAVFGRSRRLIDLDLLPRFDGGRAPVRRDLPLRWVEGQELLAGGSVWIPHEVVHLDYVAAHGHAPMFARGTNGLASGNTLLEATVHGLLEVIERDATALWEPSQQEAKAVQIVPETVDDPTCKTMLALLAAADVDVGLWDITSDLNVPTYCASIFDKPGLDAVGTFGGYGCHLDAGVALSRALSEAIQSRLTYISASRDDITFEDYEHSRQEDNVGDISREVLSTPPTRRFDGVSRATDRFEDDLALLLDELRGAGATSVIVVDLTHEKARVPVVKVIVPDLEDPNLPGYVPGPRARAHLGGDP